MSINFTQNHHLELQFADLTPEQFLNIAVKTSNTLGWTYGSMNENGFVAYTNNGIFAWNAEVKLNIKDGGSSADIISRSRGNQTIEFGKDRENLTTFITTFNKLRKSATEKEVSPNFKDFQLNVA